MGLYFDSRTGWWVAAYKDATGRRRRVRVSRIEREARKSLALLEGQSIQDRLLHVRPLKPIGFDGFARLFLDHAKTNVKAWSRCASSIKSLTPFFGNVDLTAVAPDEIERYKKARIMDKDILRHADVRTTMRYAHLAPEDIADAVRKLDEFARSKPCTRGQANGGL